MTQSLMLPNGTVLELPEGVDATAVADAVRSAVEAEISQATAGVRTATPTNATDPRVDADNPEFGDAPRRVRFKLRGTQYDLPARLSVGKLKKLAAIATGLPSEGQQLDFTQVEKIIDRVGEAFASIIGGSAGAELRALVTSEDDGLDFQSEVMPLFQYLMGQYLGARPLPQSDSSSTGTTEESTSTPATPSSSTDGALSGV